MDEGLGDACESKLETHAKASEKVNVFDCNRALHFVKLLVGAIELYRTSRCTGRSSCTRLTGVSFLAGLH